MQEKSTPCGCIGGKMRKRKIAEKGKVIHRQFFSDILLVFAVPFLILVIVYIGMSMNIERQICLRNYDIVKTGVENMEKTIDSLEKLAIFFEHDRDILNFYYRANPREEGKSTSDVLAAQRNLSAAGIANSDIANIQMYAAKSGTLIDSSVCSLYPERYYGGRFWIEGYDYARWENEILKNTQQQIFFEEQVFTQGRNCDVLIYNRGYTNQGRWNGNDRIVFLVEKQRLLKAFGAANYEEGFLCVRDRAGGYVLAEHMSDGAKRYLENHVPDKKDYVECTIDGRKMLLIDYYSGILEWTYTLAVPYDNVKMMVKPLTNIMACLVVLASIAGILVAVWTSLKFSRPLVRVHQMLGNSGKDASLEDFIYDLTEAVKGHEALKEEMQKQLLLVQYDRLRDVIIGNVVGKQEIQMIISQSGINENADYYVLLLLVWNDLDADMNLEEISAQKTYMEKVIFDQTEKDACLIMQFDMEKTIVLIPYEGCTLHETQKKAESFAKGVLDTKLPNLNYSISISGDIFDDLQFLSKGFYHAQRALQVSKNIFGESPVQWYYITKAYIPLSKDEEKNDDDNSSANVKAVEEIQKYINDHYSDSALSLTMIAEKFFITEAYVSKLFKRISGQNFSKYIEGVRMKQAKIFLDEGKTVAETSELVGYNTPQVFRRAWKRYYGNLPSDG